MKRPVDLIAPIPLKKDEEAREALPENQEKPGCDFAPSSHDDFVRCLSHSIISRNALARKGPAHELGQKQRSRRALGRMLQRLMDD